jgi:hypothetical protein
MKIFIISAFILNTLNATPLSVGLSLLSPQVSNQQNIKSNPTTYAGPPPPWITAIWGRVADYFNPAQPPSYDPNAIYPSSSPAPAPGP